MVDQFLRTLRRTPERLLHPRRREDAIRRLRAARDARRFLVVCHGNICRSPFAAAVLRRALAHTDAEVFSGGLFGPGRQPPREALVAARRRGVELCDHRSRLLTPEKVAAADLIFVMDLAQQLAVHAQFRRAARDIILLGDLDPLAITTRAVRDPVDQPVPVFDEVYARIERCVRVAAVTWESAAYPR
jgi:protein-tyrosine-phosphatase